MKVLCIDGVKLGTPFKGTIWDGVAGEDCLIFEGEIYNVIGEVVLFGNEGYILAERNPIDAYLKSRFIPLSTVNEEELLEQRQNQLNPVL